ncbi:hypothetical protein CONLIGDRAFT_373372 [Coniochaeta ligniaria NRRL 30616]|uniref:BZIP domain-containing protein n=1 Tax=Coniochaeta ligniaria NRRL 30616 TaxID=1408157 RepID=A0A1J7JGE9_9PEZI|nr:hypothetical protein CONLIGDRAFT_373372 [Coniochaeta ligniaria NRRL 30616]
MDFYRSGMDLVTGPSASGLNGQSPSIVFDNGYVPFPTIEDDENGASSEIYSRDSPSPSPYYPRPLPHIDNIAPHGATFGESNERFPATTATTYPYPYPYLSPPAHVATNGPANSTIDFGRSAFPASTMDHGTPYPSPSPPAYAPPNGPVHLGFGLGRPFPGAPMNHGPPDVSPPPPPRVPPNSPNNSASFGLGRSSFVSSTMNHSSPPPLNNSTSFGFGRSSFVSSTANHGTPDASPPPPFRVEPRPTDSLGDPSFPNELSLENRRDSASFGFGPSFATTMNHGIPDASPPPNNSASFGFGPSFATTMNHGTPDASPPPPFRVEPRPTDSLEQPSFPSALPLENRRPGRPRGGRLSAIEQYYRAVAQLQYDQPRRLPRLADFDTAVAAQFSGAVRDQTAAELSGHTGGGMGVIMDRATNRGLAGGQAGSLDQPEVGQAASYFAGPVLDQMASRHPGYASGQLGVNTDSPANRGLAGGYASGPAEQVGGQHGQPGCTTNLAPGNQQQSGPYPYSSTSWAAPGFAGDHQSTSSPADGAYPTRRTFSTASTMMGSSASDQGINPAASDTASFHSPSSGNLRHQPLLPPLAAIAPPQAAAAPPSYQYTAPPQLAGPSPYAAPPQYSSATQLPAPNTIAPAAQTSLPPLASIAQPPAQTYLPPLAMATQSNPPAFAQTRPAYQQAPSAYQHTPSAYQQQAPTHTAPQQAPTHTAPQQAQPSQPAHLAPMAAPPTLIHDLPASVVERPTFQRILRMATDPKQLPPNVTPEQAHMITQTQVTLASAKFDKVREANNKSAKRGRYKRMATTVALADEILRQKAEMKTLRRENERLGDKLERVEGVMPGLADAAEVVHGEHQASSSAFDQFGQFGGGGGATSSFFDDAAQSFDASGGSEYESSLPNALGIMMPDDMPDFFGGGPSQQPLPSVEMSPSNAFGITLPSASTADTSTTVPSEQPKEENNSEFNLEANPEAATPPPPPTLTLDRQFLREAHDMRLQLIDAVKGGKLQELGFNCHEEIDAVIQRGRAIRAGLGQADDDWDRWVQPPSNVGRRPKRAVDEEDDGEEERPRKKGKGKKSKGDN